MNKIVIERQKQEVLPLYLAGKTYAAIAQHLCDLNNDDYITASQVAHRVKSIRSDWVESRGIEDYRADISEHLARLDNLLLSYVQLINPDEDEEILPPALKLATLNGIRQVLADRAKILGLGTVKVDVTTDGDKIEGAVLVLPHNGRDVMK